MLFNFALIATLQAIDLTHKIDENTRVWDGSCGFSYQLTGDYNKGGFRGQEFTIRSCLGTHMDSPAHCFEGALDCSAIKLENCIVPAYVIDISSKAHEEYVISKDDIQQFEVTYGTIQKNSFVFFSTGWSKRWSDPASFRNERNGIPRFPSVSEDAALFLLEREIVGMGIDTLSPDKFDNNAPVHKLLLDSGKYIIENVANLENMPPANAYIIALPLKINGAVESPIRLVGLAPK